MEYNSVLFFVDEDGVNRHADGKRTAGAIVDVTAGRLHGKDVFLLFPGERSVSLVMQYLHRDKVIKNCGGPDQDRRYKKG